MGKKRNAEDGEKSSGGSATKSIVATSKLDPTLASLFASSAGPVQIPQPRQDAEPIAKLARTPVVDQNESPESSESSAEQAEGLSDESDDSSSVSEEHQQEIHPRKRRKVKDSDNLEANYLDRLAREEAREHGINEQKDEDDSAEDGSDDEEMVDFEEEYQEDIPKHESLTSGEATAARDIAKRTVFLGNVSIEAIKSKSSKKALMQHLSSFFEDLPKQDQPHSIESLRFRSTAFADQGLPKRAAYAKRELMESTTKSTNAYVVYSSEVAARKAARLLNGTVVLQRHLRVDHVAHPAKIEHSRCVFVGNLGFVDQETIEDPRDSENGKQKKPRVKPAGDVEEGLWQTFGKAGVVESVRVIRDKITRVGKGFAYVQFKDENAVEAALLYNEKKFPPLLPRKLRVMRAKKIKKAVVRARAAAREGQMKKTKAKMSQAKMSRAKGEASDTGPKKPFTGIKKPEAFVFEGYRASSNSGKFKTNSNKKSGKRPDNRSSRRGAAFKASGGEKKRYVS